MDGTHVFFYEDGVPRDIFFGFKEKSQCFFKTLRCLHWKVSLFRGSHKILLKARICFFGSVDLTLVNTWSLLLKLTPTCSQAKKWHHLQHHHHQTPPNSPHNSPPCRCWILWNLKVPVDSSWSSSYFIKVGVKTNGKLVASIIGGWKLDWRWWKVIDFVLT